MIVKYEIGEKNGKLCLVECNMETGKYRYYPIRARVELVFEPNKPLFMPDPFLYVDREREV